MYIFVLDICCICVDYPQDCPPQDCPLGGNPEVGNPESISHQDCPPQLLIFLRIVCAWYGPWVNAGDTDSIFNHNILKNKAIHAISGDIWKRTMVKSKKNAFLTISNMTVDPFQLQQIHLPKYQILLSQLQQARGDVWGGSLGDRQGSLSLLQS